MANLDGRLEAATDRRSGDGVEGARRGISGFVEMQV
jgi:hypothetical protein